jgi:hypothetical protein
VVPPSFSKRLTLSMASTVATPLHFDALSCRDWTGILCRLNRRCSVGPLQATALTERVQRILIRRHCITGPTHQRRSESCCWVGFFHRNETRAKTTSERFVRAVRVWFSGRMETHLLYRPRSLPTNRVPEQEWNGFPWGPIVGERAIVFEDQFVSTCCVRDDDIFAAASCEALPTE